MARGVMAVSETQQEAERQVLADAPQMRIVASKRIDLSDLPPLRSRPMPTNLWAVAAEHINPEEEAKLPQHEDPLGHCERETRELYQKLAADPLSLVSEHEPGPG
jgi:hypothetical protein